MSGRGNTPAAGVSGDMTLGVHQGDLAGLVFLVLLEEDFQGLRCVPSLSQEGQPFRPIVSVGERLGGDGSYPAVNIAIPPTFFLSILPILGSFSKN